MYNEEFTASFCMNSDEDLGTVYAALFYYGDEIPSDNYSDYSYLVSFFNDFINYVSYDSIKDGNHFENLYNEAKNEGKLGKYEVLHFDNTIGNIYYSFSANGAESDTAGYYYMAEKKTGVKKACHEFEFEGLLRPLLDAEN